MKFFDKITQRFAKNASSVVKEEVRKTASDILPRVVGLGATLLGIFLFKEAIHSEEPTMTATRITTNNYFLGNSGQELLREILNKEAR